jgi:rod shape-determining protein MreD
MSRLAFALVLAMVGILQGTLLPVLSPGLVLPNLVLVLVLVHTARRGVVEGLIAAAIGGIVLDMVALDPLGANGIALLAAVSAGAIARRPVFHSRVLFPMLLAVAATFLHAGLLAGARLAGGDPSPPLQAGFGLTLLQGLVNAALTPPIYVLGLVFGRFDPETAR